MDTNPYRTPTANVADRDAGPGIEVTWGRAIKVWWSLIWRAVLFGGLAGMVAGGVVGGILGAMGAPSDNLNSRRVARHSDRHPGGDLGGSLGAAEVLVGFPHCLDTGIEVTAVRHLPATKNAPAYCRNGVKWRVNTLNLQGECSQWR